MENIISVILELQEKNENLEKKLNTWKNISKYQKKKKK